MDVRGENRSPRSIVANRNVITCVCVGGGGFPASMGQCQGRNWGSSRLESSEVSMWTGSSPQAKCLTHRQEQVVDEELNSSEAWQGGGSDEG